MNDSPDITCRAVNVSRGRVVLAGHVVVAQSSAARRRGLLGRAGFSPGEGLFLTPCEWLHTFGMRFSIDVAFLSPAGRVLAIHQGLKPRRLSRLVWRAAGALELPAGVLLATRTENGDLVQLLHSVTGDSLLSPQNPPMIA